MTLPLSDRFTFQKGDTIGFTWTAYGVILYEGQTNFFYCEDNIAPSTEGAQVTLVANRYGNRLYSIQALYNPTSGAGYYGMYSYIVQEIYASASILYNMLLRVFQICLRS